jgi:thioredoxin 1
MRLNQPMRFAASAAATTTHFGSGSVKDVTDATFSQMVLQSEKPVLVDFWAPWCPPCRALGPTLNTLANDYAGRLEVVKLNIDENPGSTAQYGIQSIPTMILFKDGKELSRKMGNHPKSALAAWLNPNVP